MMREGPSKLGVVASIAVRLVLFAILGAATAVAVAWGFALRGIHVDRLQLATPTGETVAMPFGEATEPYAVFAYPALNGFGWSMLDLSVRAVDEVTFHEVSIRNPSSWSLAPATYRRVVSLPNGRHMPVSPMNSRDEFRFGWPARCVWAGMDSQTTGSCIIYGYTWSGLLFIRRSPIGWDFPFHRVNRGTGYVRSLAVPTGILPGGMTLDTGFYAACWAALFGVRPTRERLRAWRGRCRGCAYSLAGLEPGAPCPECGRKRAP